MRDAHLEIRLDRLRRHVHREVDLDLIVNIRGSPRGRLRYESTLSHSGIDQAAPPRFAVSACHRRKIDVERPRQSAMGGKLLAASQPTDRDIGRKRINDAHVNRP